MQGSRGRIVTGPEMAVAIVPEKKAEQSAKQRRVTTEELTHDCYD